MRRSRLQAIPEAIMAGKLSRREIEDRVQAQMPGYQVIRAAVAHESTSADDGGASARDAVGRGEAHLPEFAVLKSRWSKYGKFEDAMDADEVESDPVPEVDRGHGVNFVKVRPGRATPELDADATTVPATKLMIADDNGEIVAAQG